MVKITQCQPYSMMPYDQWVNDLYQDISFSTRSIPNLAQRIDAFSALFLGRAYQAGTLGEGPMAKFDQNPCYRFDAFDCVTFVNLSLALALSDHLEAFQTNLKKIAYHGERLYEYRNHFMSADWNGNNQKQGIVLDITQQIIDKNHQAIAKNAKTLIDRPNWFRYRTFQDIKLLKATDDQQAQQLLQEMHALSNSVVAEEVNTPYLPLTKLFEDKKNPNLYLFNQIPNGAIVEIVRPNWNLRDKIGTHLNISHLGFVIHKANQIYFRHASQECKIVEDVLLVDYLLRYVDSETIKGINIQSVELTQL